MSRPAGETEVTGAAMVHACVRDSGYSMPQKTTLRCHGSRLREAFRKFNPTKQLSGAMVHACVGVPEIQSLKKQLSGAMVHACVTMLEFREQMIELGLQTLKKPSCSYFRTSREHGHPHQ